MNREFKRGFVRGFVRDFQRGGNGGGGAFSPISIPDCQCWLDAADSASITETGGLVSRWENKGLKSGSVDQATPFKQPTTNTTTLGGNNVLVAENIAGLMSTPDSFVKPWLEEVTIFMVGAAYAPTSFDYFYGWDLNPTGLSSGGAGAGNPWLYFFKNTNGSNTGVGSSGAVSTEAGVVAVRGGSDVLTELFLDGNLGGSDTWTYETPVSDSLGVFARSDDQSHLAGYIGEIVMYNRRLSDEEMTKVNDYLQEKWFSPIFVTHDNEQVTYNGSNVIF